MPLPAPTPDPVSPPSAIERKPWYVWYDSSSRCPVMSRNAVNRCCRRSLDSTNTSVPQAASRTLANIGESGTPAMNATASTIAPITTADPRSLWARHAAAATRASTAIGRRLRPTSASTSCRRASRSAANTTTASFRNSDGWRLYSPIAIHARASLIVTPSDDVNGRSINAPGEDEQRDRGPAHPHQVDAQGDHEADEPERRPGALPVEQASTGCCPGSPPSPPMPTAPSPARASRTGRRRSR